MLRFWRRLVMAAMVACAAPAGSAQAQTAFYTPAPDALAGAPGTLIRQEPLAGAPKGATASRILYRSTGLEGEPIAVSGFIVIPNGPVPDLGRPIVAWAHPTTGVATECAPSLNRSRFRSIPGLAEMVRQGFVVVATDYPGLGTGGVHPYLVGASEARAVLDSVRLARALPETAAGDRFAVWGHSQGGQAALFTGLLASAYAPELKLVGVAAAAPATDLAALLAASLANGFGKNLTAMTLWSWARVFNAPIDTVVAPSAMPTVDRLADECIESLVDFLERKYIGRPLAKAFLTVDDIAAVEPWRSLLASNTPGVLPPSVPVFLSQGTADKIVQPGVTENYMRNLCEAGGAVRMVVMRGVVHAFIGRESAKAAVGWIADRFAGKPSPNDCGKS